MSTNFLFSKVCWQCPAKFCYYTSSKLSRRWFEFSLKVKVMVLNPGYLLKYFLLYLVLLMWQYWYWIQAIPFVGVGAPSSVFLLEYHFYLGPRPSRLLKKLQKPFFALQKLLFAELLRVKDFLRLPTSLWLQFCEQKEKKSWNESVKWIIFGKNCQKKVQNLLAFFSRKWLST